MIDSDFYYRSHPDNPYYEDHLDIKRRSKIDPDDREILNDISKHCMDKIYY